ncbi:MAG: thioredoxin domain-containing protein [Pyrinomonadaceae bacterium]
MKNEPKKSSGVPLAIIVGVLVLVIVGAYFLYNSSKSRPANNSTTANSTSNAVKTPAATTSLGAVPPNMLGSPGANVTIEEFADFQCGACAQVHPTMKELQGIYGNRIRFIFRNFPLVIPSHDKAYDAAVAAEAAGMQDRTKFWAMQDQLFTNQQTWTTNPNYRVLWAEYAEKIGLNVEQFKNDMAGKDAKARVDADLQRGRGMNVGSTPTVLINGKGVPLDSINMANLRQVIDTEIQNAIKSQPTGSNTAAAPAKTPASPANAANTNK